MDVTKLPPAGRPPSHDLIGYLNFASGQFDPRFFRAVGDAYALFLGQAASAAPGELSLWRRFANWLRTEIAKLQAENSAFQAVDQALVVLAAAFDDVLPAYRRFHGDLLFHQTDDELFRPFFLARILQTVLQL